MHLLAVLLQENQMSPDQAMKIMMAIVPLIGIFMLIAIAIVLIPCWFILKKAGFTPWLSLLCLIPSLGTLVLLYILAFADWKVVPAPQAAYVPPYPPPPYPPTPQPPVQP